MNNNKNAELNKDFNTSKIRKEKKKNTSKRRTTESFRGNTAQPAHYDLLVSMQNSDN